jgi:ABC-type dipeptide/oligopeptide/nickel transport system permease subunit
MTEQLNLSYHNNLLKIIWQYIKWLPAIIPFLYILICFNAFGFKDIFQSFTKQSDLVTKFTNGGMVYILPCATAISLTIIICIFFSGIKYVFQDKHMLLANTVSRLPNILLETFPQIFWLYLIGRFFLDASTHYYFYIWYFFIALSYCPMVIDQLNSRLDELREQNFILAEKMIGENRFNTFFNDIILYNCIDIIIIQSVYLLSNILLTESCMAFLMRISPDNNASLGTLLYDLYKIDILKTSHSTIKEMFSSMSPMLWITLIVIVSTIITLKSIASTLEKKWTLQ